MTFIYLHHTYIHLIKLWFIHTVHTYVFEFSLLISQSYQISWPVEPFEHPLNTLPLFILESRVNTLCDIKNHPNFSHITVYIPIGVPTIWW